MTLPHKDISPLELDNLLKQHNQKVCIIDIRTPAEFASGHIQDAINIPLDIISFDKIYDVYDKQFAQFNSPIVFHCRSGARSSNYLSIASNDESYDSSLDIKIYHLKDGILGWVGNGFKTID